MHRKLILGVVAAVIAGAAALALLRDGGSGDIRPTVSSSVIPSGIFVYEVETGEVRLVVDEGWAFDWSFGTGVTTYDWSGDWLVYTADADGLYSLGAANVASGEKRSLGGRVWAVDALDDGRVRLHMRRDRDDPNSPEGFGYLNLETMRVEGFFESYEQGVLSSDGSLRATVEQERGLRILDEATGESLAFLEGSYYGPVWSPDNAALALSEYDETGENPQVVVWHWQTDETATVAAGTAAAWSGDGTLLAVAFLEEVGDEAEPQWRDVLGIVASDGSTDLEVVGEGAWPEWSPEGARLAFVREGALWLHDAEHQAESLLFQAPLPLVVDPRWSPDGRYIAFRSSGTAADIVVMDAGGGNERLIGRGSSPAWAPDGSKIAFRFGFSGGLGGGGSVYTMSPDGSDITPLGSYSFGDVAPLCAGGGGLAWAPDSAHIMWQGAYATTHVAAADGSALYEIEGSLSGAWLPDSRTIAFTSTETAAPCAAMIGALDGSSPRQLAANSSVVGASPDGRWIAIQRFGPTVSSGLEVWPAGGSQPAASLGIARLLAWSPDGRYLAFRDSGTQARPGVQVADAANGFSTRQLIPASNAQQLAWSPDGTQVAYVTVELETAWIWLVRLDDPANPRRLAQGTSPSWSPDGKQIVFSRPRVRT